jgi:ABC-type maltose transport system permease subunit
MIIFLKNLTLIEHENKLWEGHTHKMIRAIMNDRLLIIIIIIAVRPFFLLAIASIHPQAKIELEPRSTSWELNNRQFKLDTFSLLIYSTAKDGWCSAHGRWWTFPPVVVDAKLKVM